MRVFSTVLATFFCASLLLLFSPASPAFGCVRADDESSPCEFRRPAPSAVADVTPARAVVSKVASVPRPSGDSPAHAIPATDEWMTIGPGASVWLRMDNGKNSQIMDVWLDANGQPGLSIAIYAPDVSAGLNANTSPTGRGTFNKFEPNHDLRWRGQSPNGGTWYALVRNGNSIPISYKMGFVRTYVERTCTSYWEQIHIPWEGTLVPAYWTLCN